LRRIRNPFLWFARIKSLYYHDRFWDVQTYLSTGCIIHMQTSIWPFMNGMEIWSNPAITFKVRLYDWICNSREFWVTSVFCVCLVLRQSLHSVP
jgi:hypothetical protein